MNLRQTFQKTEQSLYMQLAKTPASSLNDVRRAFLSSAKGAQRRLGAWQEKHLGGKKGSVVQTKSLEPEWWDQACHVLPEGNVVIREDDWGSIIAFTLGFVFYSEYRV
jgi:1-phosphatidylinositol-3-phosphate 5-kinase